MKSGILLGVGTVVCGMVWAGPITEVGESAVDWTSTRKFSAPLFDAKTLEYDNGVIWAQIDTNKTCALPQVHFHGESTGAHLAVPVKAVVVSKASGAAVTNTATFTVQPNSFKIGKVAAPKVAVRNVDALKESSKVVSMTAVDEKIGVKVNLEYIFREKSNYLLQRATFSAAGKQSVELIDLTLGTFTVGEKESVKALGTVRGVPVRLAPEILTMADQPGFKMTQPDKKTVELTLPTALSLKPNGKSFAFTTMIGWFPTEQERRTFNYYLERERATPSKTYLHYNGWYGMGLEPTEEKLLKVINEYDREAKKRGIAFDGYVLDDGWDEQRTAAWAPTPKKFPHGFGPIADACEKNGASFGIWISPLGGYYGVPERIASVKREGGLPADADKFDLAYPEYFNWYESRCMQLVKRDRVRYFKWDRAGEGATMHFMELCRIARDLREAEPSLFLNVTVGTWASPAWLAHVDSTWRNGTADVFYYFRDWGDRRDHWLNFRDMEMYNCFVKHCPLYPLNSVMHHGIVYGTHFQGGECRIVGADLRREIRSFFALGPNLQEVYVDPDKVGQRFWDDFAESVKWNRKHAATLVDIHWVKGNPWAPEGYLLASWRRGDGTLYLRNSSNEPKSVTFTPSEAFELKGMDVTAAGNSYWISPAYADSTFAPRQVGIDQELTITLKPLEVLVLDARCVRAPESSSWF